MLNEEIARLTGKLKFEVDNRPLMAFEKRLTGVLGMLRDLSNLANKKFVVKVSLDSKSLRSQIEKATNTKISLKNVDISEESLRVQGKRIQDYLDRTTINLRNVKVDISQLVEQKRFIKTFLGQVSVPIPLKLNTAGMEAELRRDLKLISDRNPLKIRMDLNNNNLAMKLRRAMIEAQRRMGELKIRVANPQVQLKVDKQHLINEIRAALAGEEFTVRVGARRNPNDGGYGDGGGSGRNKGLHAIRNLALGGGLGLGAMFGINHLNQINQQVTAAKNSLESVSQVSGNKDASDARFKSNDNFLKNITQEMGLNYRDMAPQFSSIYQAASPSIGVKGTQDMFRGIMQYGTTHGLSKESMKGSMVALSQMFGKDKIQAEEARQQFAERMPGGMALLAEAAKNSGQTKNGTVAEFSDLMQKGKADPKKILPELGRLMKEMSERNDAYAKSLNTTRVAQGRMNNSFEEAVTIFADAGFDKGLATFFNTTSDAFKRSTPLIKGLGQAFEVLMTPVTALVHLIGVLGENWGMFADKLGTTTRSLTSFVAAVGLLLMPFGGIILAVGALIVVLDDLATYLNGGDSIFGNWVSKTKGAQDSVDNLSVSWENYKAKLVETAGALGDLLEKMGLLSKSTSEVNFNPTFISTLDKLALILNALASAIDAVGKIASGDIGGVGDALSSMSSNLEDFAKRNLMDFAAGTLRTGARMTLDNRAPPEVTATGRVDRVSKSTDEALSRQALTLEVTVPIVVEGLINAGDLAKTLEEPMKRMASDVFTNAMGVARLNQAEK